jgi:hypothetical protein
MFQVLRMSRSCVTLTILMAGNIAVGMLKLLSYRTARVVHSHKNVSTFMSFHF